MADDTWDVIVIGAGAAGLMAAIAAAERGRRTLLLEKNRKAGVKILMSGGTRCNITHATDNRGIVEAFGRQGRFLHSALAALGVQQVIDFFEAEGVATKVEETGKVFPVSNRAIDVRDALLRRLQRAGATLALGEPVTGLKAAGAAHAVTTPLRELLAPNVILTSGGRSWPGCGTTGDGYRLAAQFGHAIVTTVPALVPVRVELPWVAGLSGLTLPDVAVQVVEADRALAARRGSLLFTHFGLSGPVVLDVSRAVSGHAEPGRLRLQIDLLPGVPEPVLGDLVRDAAVSSGKKQLAVVLAQYLPRRLADVLLPLAGLPADRKAAGLSRDERGRLVQAVKRLAVPVSGTLGFEKAEVTAGGVALEEVDSRDMRSKRAPGLWIAGEVLDLDGPIGGYNFQAAFSTGWLAGSRV